MKPGEPPARVPSPLRVVKRRRKEKGRKTSGTFFQFPTVVLNSPAFLSLCRKSRALLLDLGAQVRGYNNGDIAATYTMLRQRGWTSKETLSLAITELLEKGLIQRTRQGYLGRCGLYAFTWMGIDECKGKLEVKANPVPSHLYKNATTAPIVGARLPR